MKKFTILLAAAALAAGSGSLLAQGHSGHGGNGGGWRGGNTGVHGGNFHGGWQGGGRGFVRSDAWRGGFRSRGFRGGPRIWGGFAFPYYYPYYYAAPPYPVYADPGPTVYVERNPYPLYAEAAPPPTYVEPPKPAPAPAPAPTPSAPLLERYTLSAQELFAFDRSTLRLPQPKLDEIAAALSRNPQIHRITITGYTDRIGTDSYNLKLSQHRADAVKSYLVGKGIAVSRMTAIGKGKANPVVQCQDKDRAALIRCLEPNRRVEVEPITVERRLR